MNLNIALSILTLFVTSLLTVLVLLENPQSKVNRFFSLFGGSIILWIVCNILADVAESPMVALFFSDLAIIGPAISPFFFNGLIKNLYYPNEPRFQKDYRVILFFSFIACIIISFFSQSALNIKNISIEAWGVSYEPGELYYVLFVYLLIAYGFSFFYLTKIYRTFKNPQKSQAEFMLLGTFLTVILSILFNIVFPLIGSSFFGIFGPPSVLFFLGFTAIAVLKHHLMNMKVITTELLVFLLWIIILSRTLISVDINEVLFNGTLLIFTIIIGIFLIRSVIKEVEQRERIEKLAKELETANKQQEGLIHFISHEVKSYLTKSQGTFSNILDGLYGPVSPELKDISELALKEDRKGVKAVSDILISSNQRKGTITYDMKPFDFKEAVVSAVEEVKKEAEDKSLHIETQFGDGENWSVLGDKDKFIEHVLRNLLKNAISYTPSGNIAVSLTKKADTILLAVKDSGIGITKEDMMHLFTEGGHGAESVKVNVNSTGYGLYIAKGIVDAHKGRIWAESEGRGEGSTFFVELSTVNS